MVEKKVFLETFNFHNNKIANISVSTQLRNTLAKPSFEIFMLIILSVFLIFLILNNLLNASAIPLFGIYLAAAYRLVPSIARIVQSIQTMQFNIRCAENLSEEIKKFEEEKKENKNSKRSSINFNKEIELKNLKFFYDLKNSKKINFIFKKLNLIIKKGDF